jgi:cytoskeletal protein CcmA (bactofilin family)
MDGDVVVAGRDIRIAESVTGDILAAGWHVDLSAPASDDVRMAGGEVTLNAPVRGDVTVAGGDIVIGPKTTVTGRAWLSGGTVTVSGVFERDLRIAAQNVTIGGEVREPLFIIAENVTIDPTARLLGSVTYKSPAPATIAPGATIGGPVKHELIAKRDVEKARGVPLVSSFFFTSHLLLVGLLVIWFVPNAADRVTAALRERPWQSLLVGFVLLVTVPVAAVILIFSILGLPLGLALGALYATAIFLAVLRTAFYVGEAEAHAFKRALAIRRDHALWLVAGVVTLAVLRGIPLLGAGVMFFSVLFGLGALALAEFRRWPSARTPEAAHAA